MSTMFEKMVLRALYRHLLRRSIAIRENLERDLEHLREDSVYAKGGDDLGRWQSIGEKMDAVAEQADGELAKINELLDALGAPRKLSSRDVRALKR
jgi:hypothetical protein